MNIFYLFTIAMSAVLSLLFVDRIKKLAIEHGFHDLPNERKVHILKVPTMGGVGIFGAVWITMIVLNAADIIASDKTTLRLLSVSTLFFVIGIIDDVRGISAKSKFLAQIVAGAVFFLWNKNDLAILFDNIFFTNLTLTIFSMFLFAVIINSINFVDGLDGLCGGISLIFSIVLLVYSILIGKTYISFLLLAMIGSLVSFLLFNFYPAKIFMGDTGSLFLGSMFSMIIMLLAYHVVEGGFVFAVLFTYPIMDLVLSVARRVISGKNLFKPDKNHMHHILMGNRVKHNTVVMFIYLLNIIFAGFSLLMFLFLKWYIVAAYIIFSISLFCYFLYKMIKSYRRESFASME